MIDQFANLPLPVQPADPDEIPFSEPMTERDRNISVQLESVQSFLDAYDAMDPTWQGILRFMAQEQRNRKRDLERLRDRGRTA